MREEDEVLMMIPARTLHTLLFFSDRGKVYSEKVYQIPDAGRVDRGIPIVNVLALEPGERVTAAVAVPDFGRAEYLTMATLKGRVKRVALSEFASVRPSGLIAITLEKGDELGWARLTHGKDDLVLVTALGQALRFSEEDIRPMGRPAAGVTGIRLRAGDQVAGMEVVEQGGYLLVVTERGYGKRTPLADYPARGRATGGVATIDQKNLKTTGRISVARVVQNEDELTLVSAGGAVLRVKVSELRPMGRSARGMHVMRVSEGDAVASVARINAELLQGDGDNNDHRNK